MLPLSKQVLAAILILALASCNSHYPEGMSWAERKKYYDDYNKAYVEKELSASTVVPDTVQQKDKAVAETKEVTSSVPFSMRNNSLFPQKVEIDGNILDFKPFEVRYVGFASGTKVHWYDKKAILSRGKFLFEVKEKDRDRRFRLFN
jgi:hypothetical protein